MSYYSTPIQAGKPLKLEVPGRLLLIDSVGVAGAVDVKIIRKDGTEGVTMPSRKAAFRHIGDFNGVILSTAVDSTVGFFLSFDDVQLGMADNAAVSIPGGVVISNPGNQPVPVTFSQQIVPLGSVSITGDVSVIAKKAATITNGNPVAVTDVAAVLLNASATRRGARIRNVGPGTVAIGGAGLSFDNAAVLVNPGETWNEDEAPGAAWKAICATGETATLNIQEIS